MAVHHIPQVGTFSRTGRKESTTEPNHWIAPVVGATFAAAAVAGIVWMSFGTSDTTAATTVRNYHGARTVVADRIAPASVATSDGSFQLVEDSRAASLANRGSAGAAGCPITGGFC